MFDHTTVLRSISRFLRRTMAIALGTGLVVIAGPSLSGTLAASKTMQWSRVDAGHPGGQFLFADAGTLLPPFGSRADAVGLCWISCFQRRRDGDIRYNWPRRRPDRAGKRRLPYQLLGR